MESNVMFFYMGELHSKQLSISKLSSKLRTLKIISSKYFKIYDTILLTTITILCDSMLKLIPSM
jgi:hypothetical protein